jgi:hypothetical protein
LGYLGWSPFRCENPDSEALDFLGFPWILSFESRLFNELRGINRKNNFNSLLAAFVAVGDGTLQWRNANGQESTWGKLSLDSDFLQQIAVPALPSPTSTERQLALGADFSRTQRGAKEH